MQLERNRLFLVSNMYPSPKDVRYGIFVKRFEEAIVQDFDIKKIVLTKQRSVIFKFAGYLLVYFKLFYHLFTCNKADIFYIHFPLYFSPILFFFSWKRTNIILNFHGNDAKFESKLKKFLKYFLQFVANNAKVIVVPSNYYAQKIGNTFSVSKEKLLVYPSGGVNRKYFYPINYKSNEFVFGFVSSFIEEKGWRIFLDALSAIYNDEKFVNFSAIMVGDGPDREEILKITSNLNYKVEVMNYVTQKELVEIYAKFDAFIFPTYREEESLGLVGIEALMCGVPVISSKVGGPMGYIQDGLNGYLFEKRSIVELVTKIKLFLGQTDLQRKDMINNCLISSKKYDSELVKKDLLKFLKSI